MNFSPQITRREMRSVPPALAGGSNTLAAWVVRWARPLTQAVLTSSSA
jgi:hypothetical protein